MDIAKSLRELGRKKRWLALVAVLSIVAGVGTYKTGKSINYGSATAQILIDENHSPLVDTTQTFLPLSQLAVVYSQFMASGPVEAAIARTAGVPANSIATTAVNLSGGYGGAGGQQSQTLQPAPGQNALTFTADGTLPIVSVVAQAASAREAVALANASASGLASYVASIENGQAIPQGQRVRIQQIGTAIGGTVHTGPSKTTAGIAFLGVFGFGCVLILVVSRVIRDLRSEAEATERPQAVGQTV